VVVWPVGPGFAGGIFATSEINTACVPVTIVSFTSAIRHDWPEKVLIFGDVARCLERSGHRTASVRSLASAAFPVHPACLGYLHQALFAAFSVNLFPYIPGFHRGRNSLHQYLRSLRFC